LLNQAAWAATPFSADFEQGPETATYQGLDFDKRRAEIVSGGPASKGHCLRLESLKPETACGLMIKRPITVEKNLVLSLDYRTEIEKPYQGAYLGIAFYVDGQQWFWTSDEFSNQWRHAEVAIGKLRGKEGREMKPGLVLSGVQLYGRVKEQTDVRGQTKAQITVWFDNLRIETKEAQGTLTDKIRDSDANPPLFGWGKAPSTGTQRIQYSLDPQFPRDESTTVEVRSNFYTPAKPLEPGTWYWRVWSSTELFEGWSDIQRVVVLPEAHRFTTRPVPVEELARRARPRLLPLAKLDQPEVTEKRKAQLVANAKKLYQRGVPEHPGPHVPGDPRWPTWIEWYGRVAGKITGGTGRQLQFLGQYAMLTQDPQVIAWARERALDACKWAPEGGSSMERGDIGAQHLLRGLNWCYDACRDQMTDDQRQTLKRIIVQRAEQFHRRLNPFRGSEANNHSWLQALALAEAGIVLVGDHEEAAEWVEYVRQLYLGRFLACLGYQGDNNEGISYWGYGLGFVIDYADLMKATCGINLFEHPWLNQTARFPMYCCPPNAWAVSFADTGIPNHGTRGPAQTAHVRRLAVRTRDPYALWYTGERKEVDGLTPKAPTDLSASIHYRHIGVVIFNTSLVDGREGTTVAMHSGRYQAGHQHPDQNSFVIHAYGDKLAIDGGYYDWYGSPHFKAYSMTTLAHNTLLVDGQGQADRKQGADGHVKAYFDSPHYGYTVGDASKPEIYGGRLKQFDRRILFIKPGFVVIHDLVASAAEPAQYDWLLHAIVPIAVDGDKKSFLIASKEAALRGRFLAPDRLAMDVKTGFPVEPVNGYSTDPVPKDKYFPEWTLHATPRQAARAEEFVAAMQIERLGDKPEPEARIEPQAAENAWAVRFQCGDATHLVLFRKRDAVGPLSCHGLTTDGDVAAVELAADGKIRHAFVSHATFLRYGKETLFQSPTPADRAK
jgi:hypothetical protein